MAIAQLARCDIGLNLDVGFRDGSLCTITNRLTAMNIMARSLCFRTGHYLYLACGVVWAAAARASFSLGTSGLAVAGGRALTGRRAEDTHHTAAMKTLFIHPSEIGLCTSSHRYSHTP